MNRSPINLQVFRNANKTSLLVLGVASMVFAAAPRGKETELMPLWGDDGYRRDIAARLQPLPQEYRVQEHYDDRYAGRVAGTCGEEKIIYSNTDGQFLYRPRRGVRVADDLFTALVDSCTVSTLRVRVTGGVEGGGGVFHADVSLFDKCPESDFESDFSSDNGTIIPGTYARFSDLEDDLTLLHDLVLDYSDRGICDDGTKCQVSLQNCVDESVCQPDPIQIPPTAWVRIRFDTDDARIVFGSPATTGFSVDGYDDPQAHCVAWFAGWPTFPHASFWIEMTAPNDCETHFLAYSAADPHRPPFLPTDATPPDVGRLPTRLGDDIRLSVDDCILDAFEIGMTGSTGPYEMSIDLRWPSILDVIPETVQTFSGHFNRGNVTVARFTIPPEIELSINRLDQPIFITWAANRSNTGVLEVDVTQVGESGPEFFAFDTDPNNPETWNTFFELDGSPAVFYASVLCRGEVDSDGDGFPDDHDACPDSDLAESIVLGECPTGAANQLLDDGCTMNDVLTECSVGAHSHGELTACAARQANEWRRQGLLSGKDVGRIAHCAGTSNERRPSKRVNDARSRSRR